MMGSWKDYEALRSSPAGSKIESQKKKTKEEEDSIGSKGSKTSNSSEKYCVELKPCIILVSPRRGGRK